MIDVQARLSISDTLKDSPVGRDWAADQAGAKSLEDFLLVIKRALIQTSQQVIREERNKGFPRDASKLSMGEGINHLLMSARSEELNTLPGQTSGYLPLNCMT